MWRPALSSRQSQGEGRCRHHIRRRSPGPLGLLSARHPSSEFPRTPEASTAQSTVIGASSFGPISGGPCRSSLSKTGRGEPQGRRSYVAKERGKALECKERHLRRHITGLATEEQ